MLNHQKGGGRRPFILIGEEKDAIWGGERLYTVNGGEKRRVAEIWALSVRNDVNTRVAETGETLADYFAREGGDAVAPSYRAGDHFPILIKILDAAQPLSVQVHPDGAYARSKGIGSGKSEMWYVLRADNDPQLIYGMASDLTAEDFSGEVRQGKILDAVTFRGAQVGDVFYVPAGFPHALGADITVAEIQENADVTYRLYDYDRTDAAGNKRELHLDDALTVVRPYSESMIDAIRYECSTQTPPDALLADTTLFRVRHVSSDECFCDEASDCFRAVLALTNEVRISWGSETVSLPRYRVAFIPAGTGAYTVEGEALVTDADRYFEAHV